MISFWRQLRLLLWKAYLIKKRQNVWIAIEILIPVLLFAMLVIIRTRDFYVLSNECHYDAKSFPSSGVLPFMHSLLCSISNDCKNHATTADDTYQVNVRAERKTLLVDVVRWLRSFLEIIAESPDRWRDIFLQFANAIHIVAGLHANQTADNDQQMNLTFPFLTFFDSPQHMLEILHDDFGFDNETAEKFLDISVTPQFIFRAMEELVNVSSRDLSPFSIFEDNKVSFLCDKSKTSQLFSSVNDIHEEIDFCRITHSNIILSLLLNAKQYDFRDIVSRLTSKTLHFMRERSSENVKHLSINDFTTNLRFAMGEMRRLSPLNYSVFSNSKELEDAVFCGGISKMMEHDSGNKPATFYNPKLEQLRSRITQFILQTSPELSDQDKAGFCGNISTAEAFECKSLPFGMPQFKTLFRGYILVAPDSPVVREIVDKLNRPLKVFNMFRDIIYDFGDIASPLQDAIAQSDLKTAAQALLDLLPDLDKNSTLRFVLEHWFNNSTDPNSFLTQFQRMGIQMSNIAKCFRIDRFVVVKDEEELEQRAMCLTTHDQYFSGVVFLNVSENSTTLPDFVAYKIRHNPKLVDSTKGIPMDSHNILSRDNPWDDLKYLSYGFSFLQEAVERAIISEITNETIETGIQSQQEPYPCVVSDTFKVSTFLSLFVILSWMIPSSLLVKNIVWEKEMRLKEIMRIMGLGNAIHWLAWATQALSFTGISVMVISVLLKYGNILGKTDFTLILVLLSLFAMACVCQCLFLSTIFDRANVATVATCLIFFLCFFPCQLLLYRGSPLIIHTSLLLPQTSIGFGMNMLGYSDDIGNGTWAGLNSITLFDIGIPEITLKKVFIALSMDCIIYLVLAWYISAVFPGTFGIPKPWYFFFNVPYKLLCKRPGNWTPIRCFWMPSAEALSETCPENGAPNFLSPNPEPTASFEPTQADMIHAIKIRNLTKIYGNNTKALDSLSVDFFESQITAFLGHNGAGKTTTISILTGLYPPTIGTANVYDLDIRTDIRKIRDFLGFCPQHNILFDRMTVEEQLEFYASLKGVESSRMRAEVDSMITDIGLENKRTALANTLSGGMKRKLCIGIALIGGSKLIILDEPTAGIDAYARRSIWQLLLKHKHGRTMILSTHHMDEADVLADRIAIIAEGRLKAAGSSLFLKKRFGNGYQLTIAKETSSVIAKDEEKPAILAIADSQGATITAYIEQFCGLGQAQLIEEVEFESIYKLPLEMKSEQLAALFEGLESAKDLLGITSYGLSAPSLQQIFLNIAPVHDLKLKKDSSQNSFVSFLSNSFRRCRRNHTVSNKTDLIMAGLVQDGSNTKIPDDDPGLVKDKIFAPDPLMEHPMIKFITNRRQMHFHHAKAMFYKRLHISNRSWISLFAELILPLCLLISAEIYIKIQRPPSPITTGQPELALVPLIYGNDTNFYFGIWEKSSLNGTSHGRKYLEDMIEPPGLGTRCVDTNWAFNSTKFRCQNDTTSGPPTLSHSHKHIPYNEPQVCGCLPKSGWNCTFEDYPNEKLQRIPLKSTDVLWDLTYRNISQYRLVTSDNTTSWPIRPGTYFLGGWTFGHENAQYPAAESLNLTDLGVEDMIFIAENMSEIIRLDWRVPATQANWTHKYDPFNPENMTVLDLFKEIFDNLDTKEITKIWFNNKLWASLPINTNTYHNAVLRTLLPSSKRKHVGILAINHPMNETVTQSLQSGKEKIASFRVVMVVLALCVIPSSFAMFSVEERITFSKHLQKIFGVAPWLYLLINFLYDFVFYFVCSLAVILIYWLMGAYLFTYSLEAVYASALLMFLYGMSCILLVNILSSLFTSPTLAFALISCGMFFVGVVTTFVVMILELLMHADPGLRDAHKLCSKLFLLIPQYNLGMGIYRMAVFGGVVEQASIVLQMTGRSDMISMIPLPNALDWDVLGEHCVCLFALTIIYAAALLLVEYRSRFRFLRQMEKRRTQTLLKADSTSEKKHRFIDSDVIKEQELVDKIQEIDDYGLVVKHLSKAYGKRHLAVNNLSFAVGKGHCFGLLGVNGAGKTTTFSMLTGVLNTCQGDVFVNGNSIITDGDRCFRFLGYCPQIDALTAKITAREHLAFYARVRGIREEDVDLAVQWALDHMQLKPYADEISSSYSGGNKRKLAAAIALVGDPPVVLLDEPSAGMDPSTQQFMWNLILRLRRSRRTVIITSHSMEECEFLCTRIAIMVAGQFECIGSIQHLKERFGEGYTLTLKISSSDQIEETQKFIQTHMTGAELRSIHCTTLFYRIHQMSNMALANIFRVINKMEDVIRIEDYSLSQTTLDDVFVSFASNSTSPTKHKNGETANTTTEGQNGDVPLDKI